MRIGINASFARKGDTGMGQVAINFLKKLTEWKGQGPKGGNTEFILYLEEDLPKGMKLPKNFQKRIFRPFLWRRDDLLRKIWWEKILLPRKVKKDKCDVFLSLYQSATILPGSVKHLMVVHDIIPHLFPEYIDNFRKKKYHSLIRKAVFQADRILTISRWSERDLIRHWQLDPKKITVSYIDVDEIYKKKVAVPQRTKVLRRYKLKPGYLYAAGGLDARKNIDKLIVAYKRLREQNERAPFTNHFPDLVISGRLMPELSPLILDAAKLVKKLNLTEHVKLLDFVPQKDMPAIYAGAEAFCYPSLYEGFGLPVLEAMNQGIPVIASKRTAIPEVGMDAILYFDPRSEDDLMMVMRNVLRNGHLRETMKKRSLERARQFSWERFVKKSVHIAEELVRED